MHFIRMVNISMILMICISFNSCTSMKKSKKKPLVMAEIIFLSATGEDPTAVQITSENIIRYLPDTMVVRKVKNFFEEKGIEVQYYQGISATLMGKKSEVEQLFNIDLKLEDQLYRLKKGDPYNLIPISSLPQEIRKHISSIALPVKVEPF